MTTTITLDDYEHGLIASALENKAAAAEERNASRYGPQVFAMDDERWALTGWCWAADIRTSSECRALIAKLDDAVRLSFLADDEPLVFAG